MKTSRGKRTTGLRKACKNARWVTLTRRTTMRKKQFSGWTRTGKQAVEFVECVEHRGAMRHGVFLCGMSCKRAAQEEEEPKTQAHTPCLGHPVRKVSSPWERLRPYEFQPTFSGRPRRVLRSVSKRSTSVSRSRRLSFSATSSVSNSTSAVAVASLWVTRDRK